MEQPAETLDSDAVALADESPAIDPPADEVTSAEAQDHDEEEFVEVERNGKKYAVPKSLEGELLMQADYTRKTQSVAEERRSVEAEREAIKAEREAIEARKTLDQSLLRLAAQREHLAASYQQLEQVDLYALNQQDPVKAQEILIQKQQVANALQHVSGQLTQQEQQRTQAEQQSFAKLAESAAQHLAKSIKGWQPNNEVDKAISEYAVAQGLKGPKVSRFIAEYPNAGVVLDKARKYDELMAKQTQAKPKPEPQEKPVTRITASQGTATKDPSKMTDAEFAAWRKRQIAQRR